ncbi:MAG: rhomboid family intramembrane serine protease [Acidobacteria bacterium]|nr:rhomboid family intramembrane serine protease [Acidobacteriota bacterium]MCW5966901.1 rhomboid family intramembrane serine protease [Blastocatellales bacterium]
MGNEPIEIDPQRRFRECRRCGRPTPAHVPDCVNCGARSLQAVVESDLERADERFARAYFSRRSPFTYFILGLNIVIYILMTASSGGNFADHFVYGVDPATLIAFGAKTNELLWDQREWFRLVTPLFIHGGLIHLILNSYALWIVGPQVERLYGSARFVMIYLLAGIGGVVGSFAGSSIMGRNPMTPSVGASGAIFGLFGVLAMFGYKYRHELPPAFRRAFGSGVLPVIAINLFIGFSVPVIDNSAHIGGLVAGGLLALVAPYVQPGQERISRAGVLMLAVSVAVVGWCFARAWTESAGHMSRRTAVLDPFLDALNAARRVMGEGARTGEGQQRLRTLQDDLERIADELDSVRAPDATGKEICRELAVVLRLRSAALAEVSPLVREARLASTSNDFERVWRRLTEWVRTDGKRLGITQSENDGR